MKRLFAVSSEAKGKAGITRTFRHAKKNIYICKPMESREKVKVGLCLRVLEEYFEFM